MNTLSATGLVLGVALLTSPTARSYPLDFTFQGTVSSVTVSSGADVSPLVAVGDVVTGSMHWWHPRAGLVGQYDATGILSLPSGSASEGFPRWYTSTSTSSPDSVGLGFYVNEPIEVPIDGDSYAIYAFGFRLPIEMMSGIWSDYVSLSTADIDEFLLYGDMWQGTQRVQLRAQVHLDVAAFTSPMSDVPDSGNGSVLLGLAVAGLVGGRWVAGRSERTAKGCP